MTNRNYLIGKSYIIFEDQPQSAYFIQKYNLPGFTLSETTETTPYQSIPLPGSNITWKTFNADFILDEEMKVWYELWNWIHDNNENNITKAFSLYIYNNTAKRHIMRIDFTGAWVAEENDIELADFTAQDDTEPKKLTVFFKYAYYEPHLLDGTEEDIIVGD